MTAKANGKAVKSEETRARVLQAVLDIIVDQGMRGVRHRAVAERAGVSLGTTTYHFSSLDDLISSAFNHWHQRGELHENPFYQHLRVLLTPFAEQGISDDEKPALIEDIVMLAVNYMHEQVGSYHHDRIIELAFYHESLRCTELRQLVLDYWQSELDDLEELHRALGSEYCREDAEITFSLFNQLEQSAVIAGEQQLDRSHIERTLRRHITSLIF